MTTVAIAGEKLPTVFERTRITQRKGADVRDTLSRTSGFFVKNSQNK